MPHHETIGSLVPFIQVVFFHLLLKTFIQSLKYLLNIHSVPCTVSIAGYTLMNKIDSVLMELEPSKLRSTFWES